MTGLPVDHRFENHKNGYKAARLVRKYGVRLMPELYAHLDPMPFEATAEGAKIKSTADHHCELLRIRCASAAIEALTAAVGESIGGIPSTTVYCAFCPSQNCQP